VPSYPIIRLTLTPQLATTITVQGNQFGPLSVLGEWALSVRAFRRNKVSVVKKVLAAALCNSGYSYREVSRMVGGLSYIAVRDAYVSLVTSLPKERKAHRRLVAIDGTDVGVGTSTYHLWLARDVDSGEIMSFQASPGPSAEDGSRFLANVASQCENAPLLRLGAGPNRPRGLVNLDLYFRAESDRSILMRLERLILRRES
jgi:transposase-like protein